MVKRYRLGSAGAKEPVKTEAVIADIPESGSGSLFLTQKDGALEYEMPDDMIVYGLGEQTRGINKRGWKYVSNCSDDPNHNESTQSLYGAHNFLLLSAGDFNAGVFIDTPAKVTFDVGYTRYGLLRITVADAEETAYDLYVMEAESPSETVREFRRIIGRSYIPPRWAFGYGQSRWSYDSAEEVREVVRRHREARLPLDCVYLDIDYMERYKDFTINRETFADFEQLVSDMEKEHIHLAPIIDGGVKVEDGYDVYEEGRANGYFCKDENGGDFIVGVWPGRCCFPDMLDDDARRWFGRKYKILLDKGIEGFWNDMNEPAIFYSEKRLKEVFGEIDAYKGRNLDVDSFFAFKDLVGSISNSEKDYASFYHTYRGKRIRHDKIHNLFGYYMTRSAAEAFEELAPEKRILLFSRASYIGMHRYGGVWQGDNISWWSHLLMNIKMMPSLNMCGFLYTGADLGGFGGDVTEDLLIRWLSFGVFTPLMRNHSARGTRRQEAYCFEGRTELFGGILRLRYRLLPYLYSEYMKAALQDGMMFLPLGFVWPEDELARRTEDQLLVGESIMVAPVYEQNADGRVVYLPEDMKMLRFCGADIVEEKVYEKGHVYIRMPLGDVCIFLRRNRLLPLADSAEYTEAVDYRHPGIYAYGDAPEPYAYYMDDGRTKEYDCGRHIVYLTADRENA